MIGSTYDNDSNRDSIYNLPQLRPFRTIANRMRLQGGAVVTQNGVLESDDYEAGLLGWAIFGDGTAEFNDGIFRGVVDVGGGGVIVTGGGIILPANEDGGFSFPPTPEETPSPVMWVDDTDVVVASIHGEDIGAGRNLIVYADTGVEIFESDTEYGVLRLRELNLRGGLAAEELYLGSAINVMAAWQTYTPSNTNLTLGNGTQTARYMQIGKIVFVSYRLSAGSTTSITGDLSIGLPVAANNNGDMMAGEMRDASTRSYVCSIGTTAASSGAYVAHSEAGNGGRVNGSNPFTFATSDVLQFAGVYEAD